MTRDGRRLLHIEALRDVNSLAASIALKEEFKEQRKDDAVVYYLNNKGDNHETYDNRTSNCIRSPKHIRACTRRDQCWKSRHSPLLRRHCRCGRPCRNQAQECFWEHACSHRA